MSILPLKVTDLRYAARSAELLHGISFELIAGSRTVIMGPNGAGKSLTLRLCHGLLKPTGGTIRWAGAAGESMRHAMVFQRPVMLRRTAIANVKHALSLNGVPRDERRDRALAALEHFGLSDFADRPARLLSGGEQQRLAIARAWALGPQVIFLDEPTSALDPAATKAIEQMIQTIHADGVKVVMTTHDMGQVRRVADEVLFLHHGRLIEHCDADTFFDQPASEEARAFVKGELLW